MDRYSLILNAPRRHVGTVAAPSPLLDTYSGAAAAYSLRKLRTAYAGSAIRVRRSSDSAEQDIGFVGGVLNTASLLSFVGAGDGFVTTWYDQSGNARNATQTTATNQPAIVLSGAVTLAGSSPAVSIEDNSSGSIGQHLNVPNWHTSSSVSVHVFTVYRMLNLGYFPTIFGSNAQDLGVAILHDASNGNFRSATIRSGGTSVQNGALYTANTSVVRSVSANRSTLTDRVNGSVTATRSDSNTDFNMPANYRIGTVSNAIVLGSIRTCEYLFFASDQSANIAAIESAINSHYAIY